MRTRRLWTGILCAVLLLCGSTASASLVAARPASLSVRVNGQQVQLYRYDSQSWQAVLSAPEEAAAALPDAEARAAQAEIIRRTNLLRNQAGLAALAVDPLLSLAAQVRAQEMAASGCYSHLRPDGRRSNTVTDSPGTGENIHRLSDAYLEYIGMGVAQAAMDTWAGSEAHRNNILLEDYGSFGVGLARGLDSKGSPCWYCVQVFLLDGQSVTCVDGPAAVCGQGGARSRGSKSRTGRLTHRSCFVAFLLSPLSVPPRFWRGRPDASDPHFPQCSQ